MTSRVMTLPHEPRAVSLARRRAKEDLLARGIARAAAEDVELVVSELVGNAVQHASALPGNLLELRWWLAADGVHIRVTDGGTPHSVELRETTDLQGRVTSLQLAEAPDIFEMADSGRGLAIVDALAADWGVDDEGPGRHTVWAVLPAPPAAPLLHAVH